MEAIRELLSSGQLDEAIAHAQDTLRKDPSATDVRACLIELLCLDGQLERADDMLMSLAKHQPDWLAGAANLRQLMRAQHSRLALAEGRLADDVVATQGEQLEALLSVNLNLAEGNPEAASEAARTLEAGRTNTRYRVGEQEGNFRDCDDSLAGFFEGLGTDGHYYLWLWSDIQEVEFHAVSSPVELIWRRASVTLKDGRQGEVFVPLTYLRSETTSQKLGRETDWQEHQGGLVTGLGLKMFLLGDEAITLESVRLLECSDEPATSEAAETEANG